MDSKISILDNAEKSDDMDETVETPPSTTEVTGPSVAHLHFGSFKTKVTISEFADGSAGNGLDYYPFRKMLENFLNQFYKTHQLPQEKYLVVRSDQEVTSETLWLESN